MQTVNPGGFALTSDGSCAKTGNFQTQLPAVSRLAARAFNHASGNGVLNPGELMTSGWPIIATVPPWAQRSVAAASRGPV